MSLDLRIANFAAEHKRLPSEEGRQGLMQEERAAQRADAAKRRETELRVAYLASPTGTPEGWEREKSEILKRDRADAASRGAPRASLYDTF